MNELKQIGNWLKTELTKAGMEFESTDLADGIWIRPPMQPGFVMACFIEGSEIIIRFIPDEHSGIMNSVFNLAEPNFDPQNVITTIKTIWETSRL